MVVIRPALLPEQVRAAAHLFDHAPRPEATARFLAEPGHHLLLAYLDDEPVGFVSGVEVTHPDKGTEMLLYELGVDDAAQGRGIGTALVQALLELARERGCGVAWVVTEPDNAAALATYRRAGAAHEDPTVTLVWDL